MNTLSQLSSLRAGYAIDVASKLDVDFAGETTELAKGQILGASWNSYACSGQRTGSGHAGIDPIVKTVCSGGMKCKRFKAAKTNFWLLFLALNSIKNSVLGGVRFMADDAEQPLDPVEDEAVADGEVEVRSEQEQQKFESDFAIKMVDTLVAINEQQISSYELPNRFFTTDELNCFGFFLELSASQPSAGSLS